MPVLLPPFSFYDDGFRTGLIGTLNRAEANVLRHEGTLPGRADLHCEGALWLWCDTALPLDMPEAFEGRELFLADGHHRYEAGHNIAMIQRRDSSLRSLPSHRLIVRKRGLRLPETEPVGNIVSYLAETPSHRWRAVVIERGRALRGIDISRLLPITDLFRDAEVEPTRNIAHAIGAVERGQAEMALLVAAYTVDQIEDYARRGALLPPKSTDFYPKLVHPAQNENVIPATAQRRGVR